LRRLNQDCDEDGNGTTDYLEVLINETNFFSAELGLAQAQVNELTALVQLYQALGGGWK
jgi:multidrug efflux system outer membrane protein